MEREIPPDFGDEDRYFWATVGAVDEDPVRRYVENQKWDDQARTSRSNNHRLLAGGCLDQGIGFLKNLLPTSTYPFAKNRLVVRIASDDPVARLKEFAPSELQAKLTIFQSQTASRSSPAFVGDVAHGWCSQ